MKLDHDIQAGLKRKKGLVYTGRKEFRGLEFLEFENLICVQRETQRQEAGFRE